MVGRKLITDRYFLYISRSNRFMCMERNTLSKAERLCSRSQIESLFAGESKSFSIYPIRVVFRQVPAADAAILVSVSKKHFKRAVKRNRVKRQIREAYRRHKHQLLHFLEQKEKGMIIAFIYLSDRFVSTIEIELKMKTLLARVIEKSE